jgi:hypothetical protein
MPTNDNRPLTGQTLKTVLEELARISAAAFSLKMDLEPLSEEEKAGGAEPLTLEQIQQSLEEISYMATTIAICHLRAEPSEWDAATDTIS